MKHDKTPTEKFCHDLAKYARWRDDQIYACNKLIEETIDKDKYDLLVKRDEGQVAEAEAAKLMYHFEVTLLNTFRYTLLAGVCAILEESVKALAEHLIPDEEKRKAALKAAKKVNAKANGHSNWLQDYIGLIGGVIALNPTDQFQEHVEQFYDVIMIRNCINHSFGNIEKTEYVEQTKQALHRIDVAAKRGNYDLARMSMDGYLILGENMVAHAKCLAIPIVDFICRALIADDCQRSQGKIQKTETKKACDS